MQTKKNEERVKDNMLCISYILETSHVSTLEGKKEEFFIFYTSL